MEKVNILIIGAGIIGLSIAQSLALDFEDVVVVEKEDTFGKHTSSRNSEVIHSGIYYPQNSLKALFCVDGKKKLYDYAKKRNIPHKNTGKLVVATNEAELVSLRELRNNALRNSVSGVEIFSKQKCMLKCKRVKAIKGLWVRSTGIIDSHILMKSLSKDAEKNNAFILYRMQVTDIKKTNNSDYIVSFSNGEKFQAKKLINAAGLFTEDISKMVGIDTQKAKLKTFYCKGEYFKTNKIKDVNTLVYPLPDPKGIYLGIHLTVNLNGEVRFGPSAEYVDTIN